MPKTMKIKHEFSAVDKFSASILRMEKRANSFGRRMRNVGRSVARAGKHVLAFGKFAGNVMRRGLMLGTGAVVALGYAVKKTLEAFSMIEDAEAAFTPLLGSAQKATEMVEALNKTAASTPFQFETLAEVAKGLLPSMNGDIAKTIEVTRMMGDTAGGNAERMGRIMRGYNKALIKGKADLGGLNSMANAGIPIYDQLSKKFKVSGEEIFSMISKGKVTSKHMEEIFQTMTSEGGIFYRGMAIASETLSGKISTMKDNITLSMGKIGAAIAPVAKEYTDKITQVAQKVAVWVEANQELIKQKVEEYVQKTVTKVKELYEAFRQAWPEIKETASEVWNVIKKVPAFIKGVWDMRAAIVALAVAAGGLKIALAAIKLGKFSAAAAAAGKGGAALAGAGKVAAGGAAVAGKGLAAAGVVGGGALAAGAAGYGVGTIINKALIQPMRKEAEGANVELGNLAGQIEKTVHSMRDSELIAREIQLRNRMEQRSFVDRIGDWGAHKESTEHAQRAIQALNQERARRQEAQTINNNTTNTNRTELTIKDETGRASITKGGPGSGVDIQVRHTGGM